MRKLEEFSRAHLTSMLESQYKYLVQIPLHEVGCNDDTSAMTVELIPCKTVEEATRVMIMHGDSANLYEIKYYKDEVEEMVVGMVGIKFLIAIC